MSLYNLTGRKGELLRKAEWETLTPEELEELMLIDGNRTEHFQELGKFIRSLKAEAKMVNTEKQKFVSRERAIKRNIEKVQEDILADMEINDERQHKTSSFVFNRVDNRRTVNVLDAEELHQVRPELVTVEYKPNQTAINSEFNDTGEILDGTEPKPPTSHLRIQVGGEVKEAEADYERGD